MSDRQYNYMDIRTLKSLRAPTDHEIFKEVYFRTQDVWSRQHGGHQSFAMPNATLLAIVMEAEQKIKAAEAEPAKAAEPAKTEPAAKPAAAKKEKAIA